MSLSREFLGSGGLDVQGWLLTGLDNRLYFPPVLEEETTAPTAETDRAAKRETDAQLEAEAEAVANELPSAPTSDPSDAGHAGKKQKHDGA